MRQSTEQAEEEQQCRGLLGQKSPPPDRESESRGPGFWPRLFLRLSDAQAPDTNHSKKPESGLHGQDGNDGQPGP